MRYKGVPVLPVWQKAEIIPLRPEAVNAAVGIVRLFPAFFGYRPSIARRRWQGAQVGSPFVSRQTQITDNPHHESYFKRKRVANAGPYT